MKYKKTAVQGPKMLTLNVHWKEGLTRLSLLVTAYRRIPRENQQGGGCRGSDQNSQPCLAAISS